MVGLVQKLYLELVKSLGGQEAVDKIKTMAGVSLDQSYHLNRFYSDDEWQRLLDAGLKLLNITRDQAEEVYADYFAKDCLRRFPVWFESAKNSYEFLLMQPVIHSCFSNSSPELDVRKEINDKFKIEKFPDKIITYYKSVNNHCGLYKFLAKWMVSYYKDEAIIDEKRCRKTGSDVCEIHINWTKYNAL